MDKLMAIQKTIDRERYPFEAGGRYWTCEERFKELSPLWPAINEKGDIYLAKVREWIAHLSAYSVGEDLSDNEVLLEMVRYGKK